MTIGGFVVKREVNTNTIVAIVGFLGTFAGLITMWNTMNFRQEEAAKWITQHEEAHMALEASIEAVKRSIEDYPQVVYRLAQLEKAQEVADERVNRITESYTNQFADIRTQLSSISTQIALTNASLSRLEGISKEKKNDTN
jgi:hypothetical protein